ncbi:MAG: hypothetical protein H7Z72_25535 [Bacteroidetes bacterium]|nr:hypothetical protein [Fibrella sp.]
MMSPYRPYSISNITVGTTGQFRHRNPGLRWWSGMRLAQERPKWLAPAVLGLTLLVGVALHYWPAMKPGGGSGSAAGGDSVAVKPPSVVRVDRVRSVPAKKALAYPARNSKVAGSEFCLDCESYYLVHNGRGGTDRRSQGYTTRCCQCGSTVAFSDGYYYDIICEGKQITAKMGNPVGAESDREAR